MILAVQTNIPGRLSVWLMDRVGLVVREKHVTIQPGGSDRLLQLIDDLLRQSKTPLRLISTFVVVRGPGPFTPVRTGIVVMNTLAMVERKPVVGIVSERPCLPAQVLRAVKRSKRTTFVAVRPWYGRQPNISRPSLSRVNMLRRHVGRGRARTAVK